MSGDSTIDVWVNPLQFLEVDEPWATVTAAPPTAEAILRYLCTPGAEASAEEIVQRYKAISVESPRLFAAPAEQRLLARLIWPLRQAKACFAIGSYIGTISLCGMVSEMAAILSFDLAGASINKKPLDESTQKQLFGSSFEKLNQDRRVKILRAYDFIDDATARLFETIRLKRRKYLHVWSGDDSQLSSDAIECFKSAVPIVTTTLGLSVSAGKIVLRPEVYAYLSDRRVGPTPVATGQE